MEDDRREVDSLLRFDVDRHASPGHLEEVLGIPICEAEAAVGFSPANLLRLGSAVDSIAGAAQADPGGADGIVRARRDG